MNKFLTQHSCYSRPNAIDVKYIRYRFHSRSRDRARVIFIIYIFIFIYIFIYLYLCIFIYVQHSRKFRPLLTNELYQGFHSLKFIWMIRKFIRRVETRSNFLLYLFSLNNWEPRRDLAGFGHEIFVISKDTNASRKTLKERTCKIRKCIIDI